MVWTRSCQAKPRPREGREGWQNFEPPNETMRSGVHGNVACVAGGSSGECLCFSSEAENTSGGAVRRLVKSRVEFPPVGFFELCVAGGIRERASKRRSRHIPSREKRSVHCFATKTKALARTPASYAG